MYDGLDHLLICANLLVNVASRVIRGAAIVTHLNTSRLKTVIIIFNDLLLTRLRCVTILARRYDLFFLGKVIVEPTVVYSTGAETMLRLVKVLLLNIHFRYLEERDNGDITQLIHIYESW